MRIAVYPGSFDPVTNGHLDIITRAAAMFDKLVVAVLVNSSKKPFFTIEERVELLQNTIPHVDGCEIVVMSFEGLLADFASKVGACAIVKGLRAISDFEYEFQMALLNKKLNPKVDTVFLMTSQENMYLSSSIVRELGRLGGDLSDFVKPQVEKAVMDRVREQLLYTKD